MHRAFCINPTDNVATLLDDAPGPDNVQILGASHIQSVSSREPITLGHKIAITDIPKDSEIIKFGVSIGHASQPILAGQWVHLHNCASNFDQRSQTLDLHSGAATDTKYE
jgi:altronate dehydratase small subunit